MKNLPVSNNLLLKKELSLPVLFFLNTADKLPQLEREIAGKPWFSRLLDEVHLGEKKGNGGIVRRCAGFFRERTNDA